MARTVLVGAVYMTALAAGTPSQAGSAAANSIGGTFRAFDQRTGKLLWETVLPAPGNATPATYSVGGRQYVVIAAGGGRPPTARSGTKMVAFALPQ